VTIDSGEQHSRTPAAFSVAEAGQPTTSWLLKHEAAAQGQCEIENETSNTLIEKEGVYFNLYTKQFI